MGAGVGLTFLVESSAQDPPPWIVLNVNLRHLIVWSQITVLNFKEFMLECFVTGGKYWASMLIKLRVNFSF